MKVIVAGSRTITNQSLVYSCITKAFNYWMENDPTNWKLYYRPEIVSGGALGVDWLGEKYARFYGLPCTVFPADWSTFGKKAGILRNIEMGNYSDALIAIWDGKSTGTEHMIKYMKSKNKPIYICTVSND